MTEPSVAVEGPALARDRLVATLQIAPRLAADSIYANPSNAGFDAAELARCFDRADGVTLGHLVGETLQGMIQSVRFSGLHVVRELFSRSRCGDHPRGLSPAQGGTLAIVGDLVVDGDLENDGALVVTGDVERVVHLVYNDYSSNLPGVKARALIIDDNYPALGTVDVEDRIDRRPTDAQLRAIFGNAVDGVTASNESPIRTLIRS